MPSYRYSDPYFNEFLYNAIVNAPPDVRSRLPFDFFGAVSTPGKARIFVDTESLERKLAILGYLGAQWSIWISPAGYQDAVELKEVMSSYRDVKGRESAVKKMISANSFNFCDRDVMAMHVMMSQNCHNPNYMINRDYYLMAERLASLNEQPPDSVSAAKPAMSEFKLVVKFVLNLVRSKSHADGLTGFKELELAILLYLFVHRQSYVDQSVIASALYPSFQKTSVKTSLIRLRSKLLVDRFPASTLTVKKYSITSSGMAIIQGYLMRLINQTFNY